MKSGNYHYLYLSDSPTAGRTILYIPEAELKHNSEQEKWKERVKQVVLTGLNSIYILSMCAHKHDNLEALYVTFSKE